MSAEAASPAHDDATLAERLRSGDPAVFEELLRAHGPRLVSVARRILANDEEAREAVHEAFISAFRARATFHGDARISTWLHRIVVNTALMKLRSRRRHPEESIDELLPTFAADGHHSERFQSWAEPADEQLSRAEVAASVRKAIDELPESFRTVLILRDIEEVPTAEAAALLHTTPNAVKLRLHRARMALRTLLAPRLKGAHV
jgi:RNA polymerase sigma-70 factor (ECF subfamily)